MRTKARFGDKKDNEEGKEWFVSAHAQMFNHVNVVRCEQSVRFDASEHEHRLLSLRWCWTNRDTISIKCIRTLSDGGNRGCGKCVVLVHSRRESRFREKP